MWPVVDLIGRDIWAPEKAGERRIVEGRRGALTLTRHLGRLD